jgi:pimeloyl-ACP methyl ester carboxylesterase
MQVHEILEGSRLEIFERSGHCPNIEQAELFNRLVLEFLDNN